MKDNLQSKSPRIGLGKDLHKLVEGRRFILGGIVIPAEKGELGHSDGDVLAHAICDAILGAAGIADIGELFPDSNEAWKDADSMELLRLAYQKIKDDAWKIINLDCVVTCEKPKILPHRNAICENIARVLEIDISSVFVKGKTNEGLGEIGAGLAVEAIAVCLLEKD
jgi:2-C-methyl-D-erythritol 2,4-cyclodiphosphate synthase/2-C-methyl-D-erythritol 4-phosphate cytidylyltransferase/2-C-methyl-D-erythritol 2,4-cyclodiphosphate synthase